jgi:hypothetical protein
MAACVNSDADAAAALALPEFFFLKKTDRDPALCI